MFKFPVLNSFSKLLLNESYAQLQFHTSSQISARGFLPFSDTAPPKPRYAFRRSGRALRKPSDRGIPPITKDVSHGDSPPLRIPAQAGTSVVLLCCFRRQF